MKQPQYRDPDGSFTVTMPALLRDRFERWLRREHLQMSPAAPGPTPDVFVVINPTASGAQYR